MTDTPRTRTRSRPARARTRTRTTPDVDAPKKPRDRGTNRGTNKGKTPYKGDGPLPATWPPGSAVVRRLGDVSKEIGRVLGDRKNGYHAWATTRYGYRYKGRFSDHLDARLAIG